jgi:putative colanic acid biosynthesis acetyltransferase WcaB
MNLIRTIREDWASNDRNPKGQLIMLLFRITNFFAAKKHTASWVWVAGLPLMIFYRVLVEWVLCVELPAKTQVGAGLTIHHGMGLVINSRAKIGRNCLLRHNTTVGCVMMPDGTQGPCPIIGDNVEVGANVVVLGGIRIGDGARIGAGAVVIKDVPPHSIAVGNPAHIIKDTQEVLDI